jgi:type I restriction enzyme S subunit
LTEYLFHFYVKYGEQLAFKYCQGTKQQSYTGKIARILPIIFPPSIHEQSAIAKVLSETDELIAITEKLIAKKQLVRKGTIQELLTGKKRLTGFSKKWETKKLSEIGKPYGGLTGKSKKDFINGKLPYIPFMNVISNAIINTEYFDYVNLSPVETQNRVLKGDLLFNGSSETPEEVGMCSVLLREIPDLYLNSFCFGFRLNKEIKANGLFLSYFFRSEFGRKLFYSSAQGATRYNLSKSNFLKIEIPFPEQEEQEAIADVLMDLENEIMHLQEKLGKLNIVKKGMMQNLLTGKIRLA